jgi:hypothetical protein
MHKKTPRNIITYFFENRRIISGKMSQAREFARKKNPSGQPGIPQADDQDDAERLWDPSLSIYISLA